MRVKDAKLGYVTLALDPGDCLMLAQGMGIAADCALDTNQTVLAATLRLSASHFEALALLADVYGHVTHCDDLTGWNPATTREAWAWLPEWKEIAR